MQKFPLRMKDNDLLVTELYKDPTLDHITAISVYLTPKTTSKYFAIRLHPIIGFKRRVASQNQWKQQHEKKRNKNKLFTCYHASTGQNERR